MLSLKKKKKKNIGKCAQLTRTHSKKKKGMLKFHKFLLPLSLFLSLYLSLSLSFSLLRLPQLK